MTSRKQPSAPVWATVVVVVALVAYPLSFGPACWIRTRFQDAPVWGAADVIYLPILALWSSTYNDWPGRGIFWYANLGRAPGWGVAIGTPNGRYSASPYRAAL